MTDQQIALPFGMLTTGRRETLVTQWFTLVRVTLPDMALRHKWPISLDHCFMRICLDTALGQPWHLIVARPAIRHLTDEQLSDAIEVAESLAERPETLNALNRQSVEWRKLLRSDNSAI